MKKKSKLSLTAIPIAQSGRKRTKFILLTLSNYLRLSRMPIQLKGPYQN